jgi:photosystem II stability/assembly factor-like uncharacterized protein
MKKISHFLDYRVGANGLGLLLFLTLTLAQAFTAYADTASWSSGGPCGGYLDSLAMATNPDIIYAGTKSGVFKTVDGGATWTKTGFPENRVRVVQVAPDNPAIVYAGTDHGAPPVSAEDGIYKSEDGGSTWTHKGLSGARVNAIAIDPFNPDILYAGTGKPLSSYGGEIIGIFKSTDGGETWQEKLSAGLDAVAALLIDADNSSHIYAGVYGGDGFRKSTDGGETWVSRTVGGREVVALAMTPTGFNPPVIYAVTLGDDVYKSTDRGESWTPTNTPFISGASPWALAVDPNDPHVVYAGTHYYQGRFYKSTDAGSTWSIKTNGLPPSVPSGIVIDARNSDVYAGLSEGGVYKSTDGTESWHSTSQGMNNTCINDLAVHPTSSDTVFAAIKGEGHHLAKTTNGGSSWDFLVGSSTNRGAVAIDPQNPSIIYAGFGWKGRTNRIYSINKSADGGQSWTNTGYLFYTTGYHHVGVSDIWVNPTDSDTILVAVAGYATVGGGVYKSTDGGETWEETYGFWAATLATDPTDPQVLYFGSERLGYVFQSTDGGSSWTNISPNAPEYWLDEVRDIEVDLNSSVYAATNEGLWKRDGSDWTELTGLPTDDITALAIDRSTSPGTVYVGTGEDGVFVSQDGGSTWIPFNEGLGNLSVTKLSISASQPKMLYAGTIYGGVWSTIPLQPCECDLNHDGRCDMQDWLMFGEDWGRTDCCDPGIKIRIV